MGYFPGSYFPPSYFPPTHFGNSGGAFAPSLPSCDRILAAPAPGFAGTFPDFLDAAAGVVTFDMTQQLANCCASEEESIASVIWDLVAAGPSGVTDQTPDSHLVGTPEIAGALVSVRLGDWLPDLDFIMYRIDATATTDQGNTLSAWAYVRVFAPIP